MSEVPPYPPIDPTNFDLIVVGTGLSESLIAAAASSAGKSVLHLDPNPFYGSHFASLSPPDLASFLHSHSTSPPSPPPSPQPRSPSPPPSPPPLSESHDFVPVELTTRPLYSAVEISNLAPAILEEHSRKFNIDVCGPRVVFCADKSIDLMLKSGSSHYLEFKSIDASFVCDGNGELQNVPDSRAAIFKDKSMTLKEKNQLMKFFKLVQDHLVSSSEETGGGEEKVRISEEDLQSPFFDFITKMRLPPKIKSIILYAIAMLDYDQEETETCKHLLKTKDGIDRLALYSSSVGRFSNALGALIYPVYGQGELPQAFCRRAAVKGCLYVLRMPVAALLLDKGAGDYRGIRLASGQDIFSQKLILDPCITVELPVLSSLTDQLRNTLQVLAPKNSTARVARGICITRDSLKSNVSNALIIYPPKSLFSEQVTAIRVLQTGSGLAVCPSGMYVLYLSTLCDDADQGKKMLRAAMDALIKLPAPENTQGDSKIENDAAEGSPTLLWRAFYVQELFEGEYGAISSTSTPDGNLNYNEIVGAAMTLFEQHFGNEEMFQETASPEGAEDDWE